MLQEQEKIDTKEFKIVKTDKKFMASFKSVRSPSIRKSQPAYGPFRRNHHMILSSANEEFQIYKIKK